jgi:hypothetical protein
MRLYIMLLALAGLVVSVLGRVSHQLHEYSALSPNATWPRIDKVRNASVTLRNATLPEPDVVRTAAVWNPNNLANDQVMATYQKKGHWLGCLLDANDAGRPPIKIYRAVNLQMLSLTGLTGPQLVSLSMSEARGDLQVPCSLTLMDSAFACLQI